LIFSYDLKDKFCKWIEQKQDFENIKRNLYDISFDGIKFKLNTASNYNIKNINWNDAKMRQIIDHLATITDNPLNSIGKRAINKQIRDRLCKAVYQRKDKKHHKKPAPCGISFAHHCRIKKTGYADNSCCYPICSSVNQCQIKSHLSFPLSKKVA
jgi:hypothetical protein